MRFSNQAFDEKSLVQVPPLSILSSLLFSDGKHSRYVCCCDRACGLNRFDQDFGSFDFGERQMVAFDVHVHAPGARFTVLHRDDHSRV